MRDLIVKEAEKLIGTPFCSHGRDERGLDCFGVVVCAGVNAGVFDIKDDFRDYTPNPDPKLVIKEANRLFVLREDNTIQNGDIVIIKIAGNPIHMGLYISNSNGEFIIHILNNSKGAVLDRFDVKTKRRVHSIYSYRGIK